MTTWPEVPLSDVVRFQEGPGLRNWQWTNHGMKVINGKNILETGVLDTANTERFISQEEFDQRYRHFAIDTGDIVVSSSGTLGKVAVVHSRHLPLMMNTSVIRFRSLDANTLDPDYLLAFLRSPRFQDQARILATGAAQLNFGPSHVGQMTLRLPPITAQRRIGQVIRSVDELIENNRRRVEVLEELARATYREWFVHFRYRGHENVPLVDSPLGPIPSDWEITRIGDRFDVVLGGTPSRGNPAFWTNGTIPWINSGRVNDLRVIQATELITPDALQQSNAQVMPRRSTLLAITGATLGQVSLLEIEASANQSVVGLTDRRNELAEFLYLDISNRIDSIISKASGGAQQHINKSIVCAIETPLPTPAVSRAFSALANPMFDLMADLLRQNVCLMEARDMLLPKLVSGQIDVSSFDLDALLETGAA